MKNHKNIGLILLMICTIAGSCSKEFLNLQPPSQIPVSEAIVDESSMQTAVIGMYASMRAVNLFGRDIPIDGDLMADNIYIDPIQNSNRYLPEFTYTYIATNGDAQSMWTDAYATILDANNVINASIKQSALADQLKGEALTIRALCYFELSKFFSKPYTSDPSSPGVPLVLKYDAFAKPARNTVNEVYTQIEADLKQAIGLLNDDTKNSTYVTKYVAEALLARLYQFQGDWVNALATAMDVVNNGGYHLADPSNFLNYWQNPFPVQDKLETVFEVEFDNIGNNGVDNLSNFYSQDGYGDALCTDNLYHTYTATDVRGGLIVQGSRAGRAVLIVNKYPNTSNPNGKDNTKIIRYAEVLLILAEAYVRNNDDVSAQDILNILAQARDPQFAGYTSTGAGLLGDIYTERRKELAFEGHRYWDIVRLNQDVIRDNSTGNYASFVPLALSADDPRRIFPIPQAEINANKAMVQNEGY